MIPSLQNPILKMTLLCLFMGICHSCTKDSDAGAPEQTEGIYPDGSDETDKDEIGNKDETDEKDTDGENGDADKDVTGDGADEEATEGDDKATPCSDQSSSVFKEKDGFVSVEFEHAEFPQDWKLKSDGTSGSENGYRVWVGPQHLSNPGNGKVSFRIKIQTVGTYQFLWKSAIKTGNSGTDHNDTWLRFGDADDFYAQKDASIVFPKDTGKTPNPQGASKEGWFKVYRSGNDLDFKWQAKTFDNNAHDIFVVFDHPGIYTMEISARSSGNAIDKFVLFNKSHTHQNAVSELYSMSEISCN